MHGGVGHKRSGREVRRPSFSLKLFIHRGSPGNPQKTTISPEENKEVRRYSHLKFKAKWGSHQSTLVTLSSTSRRNLTVGSRSRSREGKNN